MYPAAPSVQIPVINPPPRDRIDGQEASGRQNGPDERD